MDTSRFIEAVLDLHNRYGKRLGISDVYAYSARGRVIRAVGTIIISPNSPLVTNNAPKTLSMYLLGSGNILAMIDLPINLNIDPRCQGERIEITNDLYKPHTTAAALNITNCNDEIPNIIRGLGRRFGVRLEVWIVNELGMENMKLAFRGSLGDSRSLARLVVVMTAISNMRNMDDLNRVLKIMNDGLRAIT
jgi:hypothetical protein